MNKVNTKENFDCIPHNPSIGPEKRETSLSGGEYEEILEVSRELKLPTVEGSLLGVLLDKERSSGEIISCQIEDFSLDALLKGEKDLDGDTLSEIMRMFVSKRQELEEQKAGVKGQELRELDKNISKINRLCQRITAHEVGERIPEVLEGHKARLRNEGTGEQQKRVESLEANERELERQKRHKQMVRGLPTKLSNLGVLAVRLACLKDFAKGATNSENEGIQKDIKSIEREIEKEKKKVFSYFKPGKPEQGRMEDIFSSDEIEKIIRLIGEFTNEGFVSEKTNGGVEEKSRGTAIKAKGIDEKDFIVSAQGPEGELRSICVKKVINIDQGINLTKQDIEREEDKMWQEIYQEVWNVGGRSPFEKQTKLDTLDKSSNQYLVNAYHTLDEIQSQYLVDAYRRIPDKKFENFTGGMPRMENEEEILDQIWRRDLEYSLIKENPSIGVLNLLIDKIDREIEDPTKVVLETDELRLMLFFLNERMGELEEKREKMRLLLSDGSEKAGELRKVNEEITNLEDLQFAMAERITEGKTKSELISEEEERLNDRIKRLIEIGELEKAKELGLELDDLTSEELSQLIFQRLAVPDEEIKKTQDIICRRKTAELVENLLFNGDNEGEIIQKIREYGIGVGEMREKCEELREQMTKLKEEGKTSKEIERAIYQELDKGGLKKSAEKLGKEMGIGPQGMAFFILFMFSAMILALMHHLEKASAEIKLPK